MLALAPLWPAAAPWEPHTPADLFTPPAAAPCMTALGQSCGERGWCRGTPTSRRGGKHCTNLHLSRCRKEICVVRVHVYVCVTCAHV